LLGNIIPQVYLIPIERFVMITTTPVKSIGEILDAIKSHERVCIFIDNSNLYHSLRNQGKKIDYDRLTDVLSDGRKATIRFYYSSPPVFDEANNKQRQFYDKLNELFGYTLVELPLSERKFSVDGHEEKKLMEKGLDCEVVYDMATLSRTGKFDAFVLVSGDADYARTVRRIQDETGIDVEVAFFKDFCSHNLMKESSDFINLDEFPELFMSDAREPRRIFAS